MIGELVRGEADIGGMHKLTKQKSRAYINNCLYLLLLIIILNNYTFVGTPLFFTIDRVDIIDYIAMTTPTRSKFVFREPKLSYVTNVFMLPFDRYVWTAIISLLIINIMWLYTIIKWEWRKGNTKSKEVLFE